MARVELKHIKKVYDGNVTAIADANVVIEDKEFAVLVGPSGCGKTTCLRMLAGLEEPSSGIIQIDDDLVYDSSKKLNVPPEKRSVGMVFQSYAVWPHMNVFDNVAYPLKIRNLKRDEIEKAVNEVLHTVELEGLEKRMPNQLSGGQQQRVALARGLVMEPKVLCLDEPLSNLDAKLRAKMRKDIRDIQQKFGITVVYVTHDQIEAFEMSDRMVIMNEGLIEQVGTPSEVRNQPASSFVSDFIDS